MYGFVGGIKIDNFTFGIFQKLVEFVSAKLKIRVYLVANIEISNLMCKT